MRHARTYSISFGIGLLAVGVIAAFALPRAASRPPSGSDGEAQHAVPESIREPQATLYAADVQIEIPAAGTLYEAMVRGGVPLEGMHYPGIGFFATRVGPLKQGNGKYLMYFINGTEASVGVSSYMLRDGDVIEWKLK